LRYSPALIGDFDEYLAVLAPKPNGGRRTSRMAVNIREAFLHHSKDSRLDISRKPSELIG
jgi:hypothetical protein